MQKDLSKILSLVVSRDTALALTLRTEIQPKTEESFGDRLKIPTLYPSPWGTFCHVSKLLCSTISLFDEFVNQFVLMTSYHRSVSVLICPLKEPSFAYTVFIRSTFILVHSCHGS